LQFFSALSPDGGGGATARCSNSKLRDLRTAGVRRGDLEITVAASGNVRVKRQVNLFFRRAGTVAMVCGANNERVKAGQVLARLDTADLERAVQKAEIALEQAQLNLKTLTSRRTRRLELARLAVHSAAQIWRRCAWAK
jgi:HlyD family secretion protein